jgi:hypothetical protein
MRPHAGRRDGPNRVPDAFVAPDIDADEFLARTDRSHGVARDRPREALPVGGR